MALERESIVDRPVEREAVVMTGADPFAIVAGIIVTILLVSLLLWSMDNVGEDPVSLDLPQVTISE
jgi:type IV secretory pathway TrbD component